MSRLPKIETTLEKLVQEATVTERRLNLLHAQLLLQDEFCNAGDRLNLLDELNEKFYSSVLICREILNRELENSKVQNK